MTRSVKPRRDRSHRDLQPRHAADDDLAHALLGALEDRVRDFFRRVDRRRVLRLLVHVVRRVLREWRVDRTGLDQRDPDGNAVVLELHAQRIGVAFHCVLRCAVDAEQRRRQIRHLAADIDDRPAARPHVLHGNLAAVARRPRSSSRRACASLDRLLEQPAVHPDAGVVHPRVDAAELAHRRHRDLRIVPFVGHVGGDRGGAPAACCGYATPRR